ncbi:MAG: hypothetical protein QY318_03370 [Candidatus Dojkabacteria bacterium]|nr:MAG: hypothetical protein QY318_03370 [Candidatus Dojkabacteria bacterium]
MVIEILALLGYVLVALLVVAGLVLSAINLPGIWLVFLASLLAAFINRFDEISWPWIILFLFMAIAGIFVGQPDRALSAPRSLAQESGGLLGRYWG